MNPLRTIAITLLAVGILAMVYGSFSYTKVTHETKLGPIEIAVKHTETVNIPMWAGVGALVLGGLLLTVGKKKGQP